MTVCMTGCATSKCHVGDIGTEILVDVCVDISLATLVKLYVMKPGVTVAVQWTSSVYQQRYVRHVTQAGDLSINGEYRVYAWVQMPSGSWSGDVDVFRVYNAFE